jgi:hypothetical protein
VHFDNARKAEVSGGPILRSMQLGFEESVTGIHSNIDFACDLFANISENILFDD